MKRMVVLFIVLLLLYACTDTQKEYPNTDTGQITMQLKWGLDYSSVKNILTEEYKLEFSKEIMQAEENKFVRVYEFIGGKYNNIETENWVVAFKNDSLESLMINIKKEQPEENEKIFKELRELYDSQLVKENENIPDENRWYFEKEGNKISEVVIKSRDENDGIVILFTRTM